MVYVAYTVVQRAWFQDMEPRSFVVAGGESMDHLTRLTTTEGRNPASEGLDQLTTLEVLHVMNDEDHRVPDAVAR